MLSVVIVSLLRSSSHAHSSPNLRCNNRGKGYESFFSGLDSFTTTDPDSDSLTLAEMNDKRDKIAPYAEVRRQNPAAMSRSGAELASSDGSDGCKGDCCRRGCADESWFWSC